MPMIISTSRGSTRASTRTRSAGVRRSWRRGASSEARRSTSRTERRIGGREASILTRAPGCWLRAARLSADACHRASPFYSHTTAWGHGSPPALRNADRRAGICGAPRASLAVDCTRLHEAEDGARREDGRVAEHEDAVVENGVCVHRNNYKKVLGRSPSTDHRAGLGRRTTSHVYSRSRLSQRI